MVSRVKRPTTVALAALLVLVLAVVAGQWVSARPAAHGTPGGALAAVMDVAPADLLSVDVTDWSALREQAVDGRSGDALDADARQRLVADAAAADLSTRSMLVVGSTVIEDLLGWSAATVAWEAYVQSAGDGALLVGLPTSITATEDRLEAGGWVHDDETGTWTIEPSVLRRAGISAGGLGAADLYRHVRLLPRAGVAMVSSSLEYLDRLSAVADGDAPGAAAEPGLAQLVRDVAGLDTLLVQRGAIGCAATDPAQGSGDVVAQAAAALARAGDLREHRWLVRGLDAQGAFRVAMLFDGGPAAAEQVRVRSALADGPFIGQPGAVADSIVLTGARADGPVALLDFQRQEGSVALMAGRGPFLLGAC